MQKIDGIFNRDSYPECDPNFWEDLNTFVAALEERLLIGLLRHENNKADKRNEKTYKDLELSKMEKETMDKLIFWAVCSGLKNRYTVMEILYNKMLQNPSALKEEKKHMLEELYCGHLFPDEQMKDSEEFKSHYHTMLQGEMEFEHKLTREQKEDFENIISNRIKSMSLYAKDSFVFGFQYAAKMMNCIFMDYNSEG